MSLTRSHLSIKSSLLRGATGTFCPEVIWPTFTCPLSISPELFSRLCPLAHRGNPSPFNRMCSSLLLGIRWNTQRPSSLKLKGGFRHLTYNYSPGSLGRFPWQHFQHLMYLHVIDTSHQFSQEGVDNHSKWFSSSHLPSGLPNDSFTTCFGFTRHSHGDTLNMALFHPNAF